MFQNWNCGNVLEHENKKHNSNADDRQQMVSICIGYS